eukprot:2383162-Lingulodinium_polyedra.AAC.1
MPAIFHDRCPAWERRPQRSGACASHRHSGRSRLEAQFLLHRRAGARHDDSTIHRSRGSQSF